MVEYSANHLDGQKLVQLEGNENTIGSILQKVLDGHRLKLLEHNGKIILVPSPEPFNIQELLPARYNLYGYIKEEGSKEPLIDATLYEPSSKKGVMSNSHGYFNLSLPEGKHLIIISYTGLKPVILEVNMRGHIRRDIALTVMQDTNFAVIVQSEAPAKDASVKVATGESTPFNFLMGEADPVRAAYIVPGVKNVPEAFNGFLVRGGGTDENLFLMDGNPVYNPSHMLGALSIVNQTVLKSMRLYKSDFPARFSGALSSVIDVYTKDGNMQTWHGELNAGLLAGSFTLEGPLAKNKTAMMVSARHSVSVPFYKSFRKGIESDFYDAHFKLTNIINSRNKLTINAYSGEDRLRKTGKDLDNLHKWGNMVGSVNWNYLPGARSFINTSFNFSQYKNLGGYQYTLYEDDEENEVVKTQSIGTYSSIQQYNFKSHAEIYLSKKLKINFGAKVSQTEIKPFYTKISASLEEDEKLFNSFDPLVFEELSAYSEAEIKLGKLFVKPGVHSSVYQFKDYRYIGLQPRLFTAYRPVPGHMFFASYSRMNQFLHLVTNPYLGTNNDLWLPSTEGLDPELSDIYNMGYTLKTRSGWRLTMDAYYKKMMNVTNYAEGKSTFINNINWEQNIEKGNGRSYGTEYKVERKGNTLSWHVAYTLSWSWRQFKSINNGNEFPYKYDRRHDLNIGLNYIINPRLDIAALWTLSSGDVYTLPDVAYPDFDNAQQITTPEDPLNNYRFVYHYSGVNQYRTAAYQRSDLAITYRSSKEIKLQSVLTTGIYNINGAPDQYSYTLRGSLSSKSVVATTGNSVFNMTPYISYTLKF